MSVLDDFERMRIYRKRATEFQSYRTIARHYSELADREGQSDKARMVERLEQLRLKRKEAAKRTSLSVGGNVPFFLVAGE